MGFAYLVNITRVYGISMVWNVLRKDFDMGHDEYIKTMYRIDSVKKQIEQMQRLLSNLIEDEIETHYASHKDTGIVYDKRVIGDNLTRLNHEMDDLEERLSEQ